MYTNHLVLNGIKGHYHGKFIYRVRNTAENSCCNFSRYFSLSDARRIQAQNVTSAPTCCVIGEMRRYKMELHFRSEFQMFTQLYECVTQYNIFCTEC
jgi:hypothetical protein